jgi:hypothetical protein
MVNIRMKIIKSITAHLLKDRIIHNDYFIAVLAHKDGPVLLESRNVEYLPTLQQ